MKFGLGTVYISFFLCHLKKKERKKKKTHLIVDLHVGMSWATYQSDTADRRNRNKYNNDVFNKIMLVSHTNKNISFTILDPSF